MKYVLEPMLFAFEQELTKEQLVDYLEELLALDNWWDNHREDMFVQNTASDVLWANNYYPMADSLKPLMVKHSIDFIQYGDINKIIEKMLSKSGCINSLYDAVCGMKSQTLMHPMNVQSEMKRPTELHNELMNLLWHVFMAHEVGGYDEKSFVVITKGISDIINIKYVYEELDEHYELKERVGYSEVNCKSSLEDFLNDIATPFLLWKTAGRKDDLDLGIRVAVLQQNKESDIASVYENYSFMLQNSFYEDYCNGHYKSKDQEIDSTIRSITDAVTEQNMAKVHAIRTGKGGNDPQLIINDYGAQRRIITTSIKLAYWKKGRELKFANMREHDFLTLHGKRDVLNMKLNVYEDVNGTRKYSSMEILK